jgi:hypothetical protein
MPTSITNARIAQGRTAFQSEVFQFHTFQVKLNLTFSYGTVDGIVAGAFGDSSVETNLGML